MGDGMGAGIEAPQLLRTVLGQEMKRARMKHLTWREAVMIATIAWEGAQGHGHGRSDAVADKLPAGELRRGAMRSLKLHFVVACVMEYVRRTEDSAWWSWYAYGALVYMYGAL